MSPPDPENKAEGANGLRRKYASGEHDRSFQANRELSVFEIDTLGGLATLARISFSGVREPLTVSSCGGQRCVIDDGYVWLSYFLQDNRFVMTLMLDADWHAVQWYFDVCLKHGVDQRGVPWLDDLFLDLVVLPDGRSEVLDEDELAAALASGFITVHQASLAERALSALQAAAGTPGSELMLRSQRDAVQMALGEEPGTKVLSQTLFPPAV